MSGRKGEYPPDATCARSHDRVTSRVEMKDLCLGPARELSPPLSAHVERARERAFSVFEPGSRDRGADGVTRRVEVIRGSRRAPGDSSLSHSP